MSQFKSYMLIENDLKRWFEKQMKGNRKKHYRSKSIRVVAKQATRENTKCKNESVFVNSKQQKYKNEKQSSKEKELPAIQFLSRRPLVWSKDYMTDY